LQEEIENRTVALTVKTAKLTAQGLARILEAAARKIQKIRHDAKTQPAHGRQSVKKLMKHGAATNTIPLDGETRLFDRVARKWNVDYSFHKTGPKKYLLLFKSGQADAITACFSEYTKRCMKRAKDKQPIMEQLRNSGQQARSQPREHERTREAARDDR